MTERSGTPRDTRPAKGCTHTSRMITQSGDEICELCTRNRYWIDCPFRVKFGRGLMYWDRCGAHVDMDDRICPSHVPDGKKPCPDCRGAGDTKCEHDDCHGLHCLEGRVDCARCSHTGLIAVESADEIFPSTLKGTE